MYIYIKNHRNALNFLFILVNTILNTSLIHYYTIVLL